MKSINRPWNTQWSYLKKSKLSVGDLFLGIYYFFKIVFEIKKVNRTEQEPERAASSVTKSWCTPAQGFERS